MGHGAEYMTGKLDFSPCNVHRKYKGRIRMSVYQNKDPCSMFMVLASINIYIKLL
jgi:hypothetical protein